MSEPRASPEDQRRTDQYEIRVKGRLAARWTTWFGVSSLSHEQDGATSMRVAAVDQAALLGLLQKVHDMGLSLVSVTWIDPGQPDAPTGESR